MTVLELINWLENNCQDTTTVIHSEDYGWGPMTWNEISFDRENDRVVIGDYYNDSENIL